MRTSSEIVMYLTWYYQGKNGAKTNQLLSPEVFDIIEELTAFLEQRLADDTPHKAIWDEFKQFPEESAPSLTGILEAVFEAQPAVRKRVDGYMQAVTAIEAQYQDQPTTQDELLDSLKSEPGSLVPDDGKASQIQADSRQENNPPAYLYGNQQAGFETVQELPQPNDFMVGKNAQVINLPNEKMQFPSMFMRLGQMSDASKNLTLSEKRTLQSNLEEIQLQLTEKKPFDEAKIAGAFETIWEIAPAYANSLIQSLQSDITELPLNARAFIIQLDSHLD